MLARWIATVAALLLACAQAGAHVRTESSVGVVNLDHVTAPLGELAQQPKTALPARASLGELAPGENPHATHCHAWQKSFSPDYSTSGTTIWRWDSAPFGETAANEQPTAGISNFTFNLRFPGQQYDRETQTHYNYFRDYEVQTGRYVQSDPVGIALDIATFRYGDRNPISFSDPFGLGLIVRNSAGAIVYRDKSFPLPCATGTSHAKGLAGEAAMAAVASSGVVPGLSGKLGLGVTIPPPPGMTGNSITDGSMGSIGLEAKCGPCAKPTKNQKQNKGNMAAAGLTDIFTFRFRK